MIAFRRLCSTARRWSPTCAASRSFSVKGASAGNLVRFLAPDGGEKWGKLMEGGKTAKVLDSVFDSGPGGAEVEISKVLAPLPVDPAPAVIVVGLNYKSHAEETGAELPVRPIWTLVSPTSVIGPGAAISIPATARQKPEVDYEGEMAIVIGKKIRDASPEEALEAVLGVTSSNDVSARRWQGKKGGGQWTKSKSFDTFCPVGPTLLPVTGAVATALACDLAAPGGKGLAVKTTLNGALMQNGDTSDMNYGVARTVSYLSEGVTLLPGTIILTGTPPGVGYPRKPPVYLKAGDCVEVELEGAGILSNTVEDGP